MKIAVVGRGCVLPGAHDPSALWDLVAEGRDAIGPVPRGRWRMDEAKVVGHGPDRAWSDRGGYVRGFDDSLELDPLFAWTRHAGSEAMREAGIHEARRGGVVLGNLSFPTVGHNAYAAAVWRGDTSAIDPRERFHSGLPARLLADEVGLRGSPSFCLDAACASSLYAIALACDALVDGRADVMLAGAVNCTDDLFIHIGFCALGALSKSGRSRPFHPDADGLVPAEGAAMVALMRLEDAKAEGRRVFGVIRSVGLANDGRARGFLAPSEDGQARAMSAAYEQVGLSPSDVAWIECHATGTPLGDATEIRSTARVFEGCEGVPMGSLKANLGHLITTAGAAGLLKVLGAMQAGSKPPTPHLDRLTDALEGTPLRVVRELEPWTGPRRAAISAFGFGGNDAHLIVEAEDEPSPRVSVSVPRPVPLAIVGIGVRVGALPDAQAYLDALATGRGSRRAEQVVLPIDRLRMPPADLSAALAQQTLLLAAVYDALPEPLDAARTSVLVGMECDSEIARYGVRWREGDERCATPLSAAGVIGAMPNIPANRVNAWLDARGPSYTVSADEESGVRALEIAARALRQHTIDHAIVGAVDLACEPVHEAASGHRGGDAAVALVVERLEDARALGRPVLAIIETATVPWVAPPDFEARFGHAHAAVGLLDIATAALTLDGEALVRGFGLRADEESPTPSLRARSSERTLVLPAHPRTMSGGSDALSGGMELLAAPSLAPVPLAPVHPEAAPALPSPPMARRSEGAPEAFPTSVPVSQSRAVHTSQPLATGVLGQVQAAQRRVAELHQQHVAMQTELHRQFLAQRREVLSWLLAQPGGSSMLVDSPPPAVPLRVPVELPRIDPPAAPEAIVAPAKPAPRRRGLVPATPPPAPSGPSFERAQLEVHASGAISSIFGELFSPQDAHWVQCRMPEPPLLLADRVTGLTGEPTSMGKGSVWTETDVRRDSWYLQNGRMPAGLMIESGQADLFLISWLGADLLNRGERAYRLLGCTLTWHRSPPQAGETLRYDIHVDGHASQGDVRLFFFHYDCHIDGEPALTVRSGQAGFFTEAELAESAGVIWSPEEQEIDRDSRLDPPALTGAPRSYDDAALESLSHGDVAACFGEAWAATRSHLRTPTLASGDMRFLETITDFDVRGGAWGRGYLRAVTTIRPDDWYFDGHFKNDPCMPGTLMLEGCLSAMSFALIGMGYTLDRDGWRFEPIPDETYSMICRGQVLPTSRELVYEVFVEEVHEGPIPKLYADLLCTVDGLKAFHARRVGLQLVPDFPITSLRELPRTTESVVSLDGLPLDATALLHSALGRPSLAFGPRYAEFDHLRRAPRLPAPPYHMVSRVESLDGKPWTKQPGASVEIAYDVPPDAWFFGREMPYALLLETALQPCGWLATYVGSTLGRDVDLRFRNLDGEGEVLGDVRPDAGTLHTRATLTSITDTAAMVIVAFDVVTRQNDTEVHRLKTVFGFFPDAAFENQAGLPTDDTQRALFETRSSSAPIFEHGENRLRLLDELPYYDPAGGRAGLGAARAERAVDASEWFFSAHFFQDPVQPGSLGIEAMQQLLRFCAREAGVEGRLLDRPTSWKYRGQVRPTAGRIAVTLELTSVDATRVEGESSFWVDGKRIYEAQVALDVVDPREELIAFWRGFLGVGPQLGETLYLGLLDRFVGRVEAHPAFDRLNGPALYLANHQTAIETLMLSVVAGARSGIPLVTVAKQEHRESWYGRLLAWLFAHPEITRPELTAYFDRSDPASLPALLRGIPNDRSILLHAEGTRSTSARDPIGPISGVPVDVAIERGLPIVPVRLSGGLPVEPSGTKLDFPHGMAAQDITFGRPIAPDELSGLPYKERLAVAHAAMEALRDPNELPNPPNPALAGLTSPRAVLREVLGDALPEATDDPWIGVLASMLDEG